jgi:hypothetical protein
MGAVEGGRKSERTFRDQAPHPHRSAFFQKQRPIAPFKPNGAPEAGSKIEEPQHHFSSGTKMSSIATSNSRANLNAKGRLGSYLPVSIAFTVCRDTSTNLAKSDCDKSLVARSSRSLFFICIGD